MASQDQYIQIASLPEDVRQKVVEFIELLMQGRKKEQKPHLEKRPLGLLEGKIRMAYDFDEPLDDFKEYME